MKSVLTFLDVENGGGCLKDNIYNNAIKGITRSEAKVLLIMVCNSGAADQSRNNRVFL
jgi:hypothetical protein